MKTAKQKEGVTPAIVVAAEVARRVRQHARSNMKTEVCGILIGAFKDGTVRVDACIAGKDASQAGTHVTFTQDTWQHIYKIKDAEYPEARIVGWYHSHPGFGIFLSDHDTFIHRNFFSASEQVAWVYDPHSDEEGFFGWAGERIERLGLISFADSRGGEECSENHGAKEAVPQAEEELEEDVKPQPETTPGVSLRWIAPLVSHLLAIVLGLLLAWYVFPRIILVPIDPRTGMPLLGPSSNSDSHQPPPTDNRPATQKAPAGSQQPDSGSATQSARPK